MQTEVSVSLAPPRTVRAAALIQYATLALAVVGAVLSVLTTVELLKVLPGQYEGEQREAVVDGTRVAAYGLVVVWLVFSGVFAMLARWYSRGRRWARNWTWGVAGLLALCGACGLMGSGRPRGYGDDPLARDDVQRALDAATPGWWSGANMVVQGLGFAAYAAIIVLLALPASSAFFQRPEGVRPASGVAE
ncbi:hypothetical protein Afil01_19760 [Actinorhabdospora filicis]|uniref:Uncharacterized protein n=1 Tax=Actinorhabdospora filicis TaxID=1785913 RepID=A0A9W6SK84_9ACTN|nr:hypothetical protein [Actinorhabdospora filicis]GLZ77169.1 hypothetical protein Afil01_19760 [Actinorhabdospora filicis]